MTSTILSFILKAVISIAVVVITSYVIPWLKEKRLYEYVMIAVQAAEQMIRESGAGAKKYELVEEWLTSKFHISAEEAKSLIESAVYEMNLLKDL